MTNSVAIVGAGIAGLAAARYLGSAGVDCTVFEKSRGLGGRMATRRVNALQFDHGAQFFTAKGPRFRSLVDEWRATGVAAEWFDGAFVGAPRMSAPARALATGHTVLTDCTVSGLRRDAAGWTVLSTEVPVATPGNGTFSAVILAMPAPQIIPVAASVGVTFADLERVRYAPCWALMTAYGKPTGIAGHALRFDKGPISWIARDGDKPGRDPSRETIVAHASPGWSRQHLEDDATSVSEELSARLRDMIGDHGAPVFLAAHRWRYALAEVTAGVACLWNDDVRLGACGDWGVGPRVEGAFDSGEAMAGTVLRAMGMANAA